MPWVPAALLIMHADSESWRLEQIVGSVSVFVGLVTLRVSGAKTGPMLLFMFGLLSDFILLGRSEYHWNVLIQYSWMEMAGAWIALYQLLLSVALLAVGLKFRIRRIRHFTKGK